MTTMYMVSGLSHSYEPNDAFPLRFDKQMKNWVVQWTTPNNTKRTVADTAEEALALWVEQTFSVPSSIDSDKVESTLVFTVEVTKFTYGIETRAQSNVRRVKLGVGVL